MSIWHCLEIKDGTDKRGNYYQNTTYIMRTIDGWLMKISEWGEENGQSVAMEQIKDERGVLFPGFNDWIDTIGRRILFGVSKRDHRGYHVRGVKKYENHFIVEFDCHSCGETHTHGLSEDDVGKSQNRVAHCADHKPGVEYEIYLSRKEANRFGPF